ncbi:MAG TPA: alpha/beta fold hydrolase [Actinomycetes bacterium]|nr:alpha/beta fold hydrolase [Actinomycetes bacterium]
MLRSLSPRRRLLLLAVALLAIAGSLAGLLIGLPPGKIARPSEGPVPVVLVHGYDGTPTGLATMAARLRAGGRQVVAVALPNRGTGDIEVSAQVLARSVDGTRAQRVDLVGYSAGGIVVRDYLGQPGRAARARHIVLLGTPNHGAQLAGMASLLGPQFCNGACAQLAPDSALLRRLNRPVDGVEIPAGADVTSIWTARDQTVTPPTSAVLAGARNIRLQDVCADSAAGHADLVRDPLAIGLVLRAIDGGLARQPTFSDCAATRAAGAPATRAAGNRSG